MDAVKTTSETANRLKHLSWRAGFGDGFSSGHPKNPEKILQNLLQEAHYTPEPLSVPETQEIRQMQPENGKSRSAEEKKKYRQTNRRGMATLNLAWLNQMVTTKHPYLEKMALFWHGHFACRVNNVLFSQQLINTIRRHALGSFRDLLFAVSKSPAMLQFLNNQQNRKKHPNENFAREVMELFTMGRGHYTEKDIKEGARGFTGWGYNREGLFVFRQRQHDEGVKTFLGKTGHFHGEDLLDIILEKKATAYFITQKLYRFFVNETPAEEVIRPLAEQFYQSGYQIAGLMDAIFRSEEFYGVENCANRIKSPVELLVGMRRSIPVTFENRKVQLLFERLMDQVLFHPPNVGGWPGGRSWIDSATLVFRMRLPQIIYTSGIVNNKPKDMPDEMMDDEENSMMDAYLKRYAKKVKTNVRWKAFENSLNRVADADLPAAISERLLAQTDNPAISQLQEYADAGSRAERIQLLSIAVMSQPEYQLC